MDFFLVLDTETTGVTSEDTPCQIAVAKVSVHTYEILDHYASVLRPERPIHLEATAIHGITDQDTVGYPTLAEAWQASPLPEWFSLASIICGHNVNFDIRMCRSVLPREDYLVLDTLTLSRCVHPSLPNHRLQTLVAELGLPHHPAHDALGDVLTCVEYLRLAAEGRDVYQLQEYAAGCRKKENRRLLKSLGGL